MEKQLKNYLNFYLGCEVHSLEGGSMTYTLSGIDRKGDALFYDGHGNEMSLSKWKIVLRPLSDMSKEEAIDVAGLSEWEGHFNDVKAERNMFDDIVVTWQGAAESREVFNATGEVFYCSEQFVWLLSNHFDLFGLIEAGLAIDKTTLKT